MSLNDQKVLMIAPSRVLAAVLSRELGDIAGVKTVSCKTLTEALDRIKLETPDFVVSSTLYEDGSGIDLANRVKSEPLVEKTRFMVISSELRLEMLEPLRQAGIVALLSRPFTKEYLDQAVSSAQDHKDPDVFVSSHKALSDIKVLVVDNSKMSDADLMSALDELGIGYEQVTFAEGTSNAIDKLSAAPFDVIISDYHMNNDECDNMLKFLKGSDDYAHIPIIMVSSSPNNSEIASVCSRGVTVLLKEAFSAESLHMQLKVHV